MVEFSFFVVFDMFWRYLTPQITFLSKTLEANQFVLLRAFRRVPIYIFDFLSKIRITQPLSPKKVILDLYFL